MPKENVTIPAVSKGPDLGPLAFVGSLPAADSPFGVSDLVGFVWQYTDVFEDDHDVAVIVKGSGHFHPPAVSSTFPSTAQYLNWYYPPARQVNRHNKYFLMSNSFERAGTVGFRCVADHLEGPPAPYHYWGQDTHHKGDVELFV